MGVRLLAVLGLAAVLGGCATTTVVREEAAPSSRSGASSRPAANAAVGISGATHRVQAGDTLYGIAFRNSLDWRELARWNGIGEPFLIQPGQLLRLSTPGAAARPSASRPTSSVAAGPPPIPRGPASATRPVSAPSTVITPPPAPPATRPTPVVANPAPSPNASNEPTTVAASTPSGPAGPSAFRAGQWQWPTQGQVISRYAEGDKARQGIAIAGTAGQPVRASSAGTVVYSGAGLVGYGELIIIKHSDEWLSAYGHNRRRLVAEGANVSAGQQIAELGRTGTSRDMLHFEIRRNGKPVDPTPLLPRR